MDWIIFFLVFLAICAVWFFITRIWVGGIDLVISALKKSFSRNKNEGAKNWHTLEEIRDKNKEDPEEK